MLLTEYSKDPRSVGPLCCALYRVMKICVAIRSQTPSQRQHADTPQCFVVLCLVPICAVTKKSAKPPRRQEELRWNSENRHRAKSISETEESYLYCPKLITTSLNPKNLWWFKTNSLRLLLHDLYPCLLEHARFPNTYLRLVRCRTSMLKDDAHFQTQRL